jgi:Rrf2 family protein
VTKYQIAEAEELSADYIEQIMVRLKASGLVISHRGRNGGFSIARDPKQISMADILMAVEGPIRPVPCIDSHCKREASCPTRSIWEHAVATLDDLFGRTTLAKLVEKTQTPENLDYSI